MRSELRDDAAAPAPAKAGDNIAQHLLIQSAFDFAGDVIERVADVGRQPRRPSLDPANIEGAFFSVYRVKAAVKFDNVVVRPGIAVHKQARAEF